MTIEVAYELKGVDKLVKILDTLPETVRKQCLKPALRKGGLVIRRAAKRNVSGSPVGVRTGLLRKYISMVSLKDRAGQSPAVLIGIPKKTKLLDVIKSTRKDLKPGSRPYYWRMLEFGTKKMRARPWLRPAVQSTQAQVAETLAEYHRKFFNTYYFNHYYDTGL